MRTDHDHRTPRGARALFKVLGALVALCSVFVPTVSSGDWSELPDLGYRPASLRGFVGTLGRVKSDALGVESAGGQYFVWAEYLPGQTMALDLISKTIVPWDDAYLGNTQYRKYFLPGNTVELALAQGPLEHAHVVSTSHLHDLWTEYEEIQDEVGMPVLVTPELGVPVLPETTHVFLFNDPPDDGNPVALEFPANPDSADVSLVRYGYNPDNPEQIRTLLVDETGFVHHRSVGTIAYLTDYFNRDNGASDIELSPNSGVGVGLCYTRSHALANQNDPTATWDGEFTNKLSLSSRFGLCPRQRIASVIAPVPAAQVSVLLSDTKGVWHDVRATPDPVTGAYQLRYLYDHGAGVIPYPVVVEVPLEPFDEDRGGIKFVDLKTAALGGGWWVTAGSRSLNFAIDVAGVKGAFQVANVSDQAPSAGDTFDYYASNPTVSVGEETLYESTPLPQDPSSFDVAGGVQRHHDFVADLHHRGLLTHISKPDLLNTDAYIFASDSNGRVLETGESLYQFQRRGLFPPEAPGEPGALANVVFNAAVPHPGAQHFKLYLVNRVTGYIGSALLRLVSRNGQDGASTLPGGSTEGLVSMAPILRLPGGQEFVALPETGHAIPMLPPNIKVTVERTNDRVQGGKEQTVGFEGGGLADDTIRLRIDWRDHDGSPMPRGIPGFSGRLSVADQGGMSLRPAANILEDVLGNQISHFDIEPGNNVEVVKIPDGTSNQHYYLHVHAVPRQRCEDNTARPTNVWTTGHGTEYGISAACLDLSSGLQDGALTARPQNYVPIKVPVFDEQATRDELQALANQVRASGGTLLANSNVVDGELVYEAVKPTYRHLYRPEMQFSLYDIPEGQPDATVVTDLNGVVSQTGLDFSTTVEGPTGVALPSWGPQDRELLWGIGFGEYEVLADGNPHSIECTPPREAAGECELDQLDTLAATTPSGQIGAVADIASELTPEDFLAIQLYMATDAGNVLYEYDLGYPLVSARSKFIELERLHDLSRLDEAEWTDSFDVIDFSVNRPVKVSGRVLRPDGAAAGSGDLPFVQDVSLGIGEHSLVVDYSTLIQFISDENAAADSLAPNFIIELEFRDLEAEVLGSLSDTTDRGPTHIVRYPGRLQYRKVGEPVGQLVQHNVNISDGSVRLERTDLSIPGAGPHLEFKRFYSNVSEESSGHLGPGWSHNLDYRLVPMAKGFIEPGEHVPDWVFQHRGRIHPRADVESDMVSEGSQELGKIQVNGTVFTFDGTNWVPAPGRFAHLRLENEPCSAVAGIAEMQADDPQEPEFDLPGCFVFTSRDGTSYFYDEPKMVLPPTFPLLQDRTMLSLYDRLAYRVNMTDLGLDADPIGTSIGPEPKTWSPTKVRLVRDRFGQTLTFGYEGEEAAKRLRTVTDGGRGSGGDRSCTLMYTTAPGEAGERLQQVQCLTGQDTITVGFTYDPNRYLQTASRGEISETYGYEAQPDTASPPQTCTTATNPDGENNLSHCPFNLVSIADERGNPPLEFKYFQTYTPVLGLDAVQNRPYTEIVERVTYPPTVGPDPVAEVDFDYSDNSAGAFRSVDHMRSDIPASEYTLDHSGHPHITVDYIDSSDKKTTTQTWVNGLVQTLKLEGPLQSLSTSYVYDEGEIATETTTGTSNSGDSISVLVTNTWETKTLSEGGEIKLLRSTETVRNGVTTSVGWDYDEIGFMTGHTDQLGETWTYSPDPTFGGQFASMTAPGSPSLVTSFEYDDYGNLRVTTVEDLATVTERNSRGEVVSDRDPEGNETTYEYDATGRVRFARLPSGAEPGVSGAHHERILETTYDGRVKKTQMDRNGLVLTYHYTGRNQIERVTRSSGGGSLNFTYDAAGNLRTESDWKGVDVRHTYDGLGRETSTTNRAGDTMTNSVIDILGNVWESSDYNQHTTSRTFDGLGRATSAARDCSITSCAPIEIEHDRAPHATRGVYGQSETDAAGVTFTDFDESGRIVATTRVAGGSSSTSQTFYDERGNVTERRDAEGQCTFYDYDDNDRLVAVLRAGTGCSQSSGYLVRYQNDGNGNVTDEWSWPRDTTPVRSLTSPADSSAAHIHREFDTWDRLISESAPAAIHHPEIAADAGSANPQGADATFRYDGEGNIVRRNDHRGNSETWVRNIRGLVTAYSDRSVSNQQGRSGSCSATFCYPDASYDENGNAGRIEDARGNVTTVSYDAADRPLLTTEGVGATNPIGGGSIARTTQVRQYDGMGHPLWVESNGVTSHHTYDERGQLHTRRVESSQGDVVETFEFDSVGRPASQTSEKNGERSTRTFSYSADERTMTTTFSFSGEDQDTAPQSGSFVESRQRSNKIGQVEWSEGRTRQGVTPRISHEFDAFRRVDVVRRGNGAGAGQVVSTARFNAADLIVESTDADTGAVTFFEYDKRRRLVRTESPATSTGPTGVELRAYDENGNLRALKAPQGPNDSSYVTRWTYDASDRPLSMIAPVGENTSWTYDVLGNQITSTTPLDQSTGRVTRTEYDVLGRATRIIDRNSVTVTFDGYDARDNLLSQTIPGPNAGVTTSFTYDELDNLRTRTEPGPAGSEVITTYSGHDLFGNPSTLVDANGATISYQHDHYGRRTTANYPAGQGELHDIQSISWNYEDDQGRVTVTETKDGVVDQTVRQEDLVWQRPVSVLRTHGNVGVEVNYTYHADGSRHTVETLDLGVSGTTRYEYDERNRLALTVAGGDTETSYRYQADGRLEQVTYPNSLTTGYSYDSSRRVERIETSGGDQNVAVEYDYDLNGNRTAQREYRGGLMYVTSYGYDAIDRLFTSTFNSADGSPPVRTTYAFEGYNRSAEQVDALTAPATALAAKSYEYSDGNHLQAVTESVEDGGYGVSYQYDDNGNTVAKVKDTGGDPETTNFAFDVRNQLRSVRHQVGPSPPEVRGQYDYDAGGLRVRARQTGRGDVDYYYDESAVLEERTDQADLLTRYHYDARALALQDATQGDVLPKYYHQDALGTTTHISAQDGGTVAEYMVDAWGRPRDMTAIAASRNRKLFTGHEFDAETGLYYAQARYYDPDTGRFLSQDSYLGSSGMPASLHRYMYAANNPGRYVDPSGHNSCVPSDGIARPGADVICAGGSSDSEFPSIEPFEGASLTGPLPPLPGAKVGIDEGERHVLDEMVITPYEEDDRLPASPGQRQSSELDRMLASGRTFTNDDLTRLYGPGKSITTEDRKGAERAHTVTVRSAPTTTRSSSGYPGPYSSGSDPGHEVLKLLGYQALAVGTGVAVGYGVSAVVGACVATAGVGCAVAAVGIGVVAVGWGIYHVASNWDSYVDRFLSDPYFVADVTAMFAGGGTFAKSGMAMGRKAAGYAVSKAGAAVGWLKQNVGAAWRGFFKGAAPHMGIGANGGNPNALWHGAKGAVAEVRAATASQNAPVTPPSHQLPATAMYGSRVDIIEGVNSVLAKHLDEIRSLAPDARIGYRGSLARGFKGAHKDNAPFDGARFDVDAFIVSDTLKTFRPRGGFPMAKSVRHLEKQIQSELKSLFPGLKGGKDKFTFRVFRSQEAAKKFGEGDVQIFIE